MIEVREVTVKDAKNLLEFSNQVGSETNNLPMVVKGWDLLLLRKRKS